MIIKVIKKLKTFLFYGKLLSITSLTAVMVWGCKTENNNYIPDVPVDFYVPLSIRNELKISQNACIYKGKGYGGVIIINTGFFYSAFDACCPHEVSTSCSVTLSDTIKIEGYTVIGTGPHGKCTCCGSTFNLSGGGYPSNGTGPASMALKQYKVSTTSGDRLWIHN